MLLGSTAYLLWAQLLSRHVWSLEQEGPIAWERQSCKPLPDLLVQALHRQETPRGLDTPSSLGGPGLGHCGETQS